MKLFQIEQCSGNTGCPNSLLDTEPLAQKLYKIAKLENIEEVIHSKIKGPIRQHHCFRVSIANCPNACSQVQIKDVGIISKVKISIDMDKCSLCGKCVKTCFENALKIKEHTLTFNQGNCIGCGMCIKVCREGAIKVIDKGFQILAGGKLGRHPMLALEIKNFTSFEECIDIFKKILIYYKENSIIGERLGTIFQRMKINEHSIKNLFT